jgi:hypothetical protein
MGQLERKAPAGGKREAETEVRREKGAWVKWAGGATLPAHDFWPLLFPLLFWELVQSLPR